MIIGCTSPDVARSVDGFMLRAQACEHHASLGLERDAPVLKELSAFLKKGGVPSTNVVALIQQDQRAFALIAQAYHADAWPLPDITSYSLKNLDTYISSWISLNRVATAQAIQLYLDHSAQEACSFLAPFNAVSLQVSKTGPNWEQMGTGSRAGELGTCHDKLPLWFFLSGRC